MHSTFGRRMDFDVGCRLRPPIADLNRIADALIDARMTIVNADVNR